MYRIPQNPALSGMVEISENYLEILNINSEGIFLLDDLGIVLFANKAFNQFFEADAKEVLDKRLDQVIPSIEAILFDQMHQEAIKEPSNEFNTACIDRKSIGQRIEVFCLRPPGNNKATFFYLRDISRLARVEKQLRERNAFLNGLIESSVDGIIAADMKGNIVLFNKGAQDLLGYTEQEAIDTLHTSKLYVKGTAHEIMRKMRSVDFGGKGKCIKHRVIGYKKNGDQIPISLSGSIIYDHEGNETASFGIFTDLSQVERMQKNLKQKQMELIQSEKMASLGRLAAGVAHEINNPLSGVLIFAGLVKEDLEENSPFGKDIERIIEETNRCKTIVRELLDFSRQDESSCDVVDINKIIKDGIHLIRNQAVFHNVIIDLDLCKGVPPVTASGMRLSQVFLNLYFNAAEAMDGHGTLDITTKHLEDENKIRVSVSDTGHGIPDEVKPKIFEPFFTTKEFGKGTGLGLSVSYGILQECGATIEVESVPEKGTSFIMDFHTIKSETQTSDSESL